MINVMYIASNSSIQVIKRYFCLKLVVALQRLFCSCAGNFAILQFFIERKRYPVDLKDKDGNTLLHILCRGDLKLKKQEAIKIVLEAGGSPLITNNQKEKPIDLLSKSRQVLV